MLQVFCFSAWPHCNATNFTAEVGALPGPFAEWAAYHLSPARWPKPTYRRPSLKAQKSQRYNAHVRCCPLGRQNWLEGRCISCVCAASLLSASYCESMGSDEPHLQYAPPAPATRQGLAQSYFLGACECEPRPFLFCWLPPWTSLFHESLSLFSHSQRRPCFFADAILRRFREFPSGNIPHRGL